jgi:predicted lipid-binding transport protein (Tim44 family)
MSVLRSTAAPRASLVGAALLRPRLVLPATSQRQSVLAGCSLRNAGRSCSPNWAHQSLRAYATSPARPEAESVAPTSASEAADAFVHAPTSPAAANYPAVIYVGPVSKAFRFLKCVRRQPWLML